VDRDELDRLVTRNDPDALVRLVDSLTASRDWDGLVAAAAACRAATATGRQLWPVASLAEYRLALRAPGPWAGAVVRDDTGYLSLGPLSEVAASTHPWAELAPWLDTGPITAFVANERVMRGEDLTAVDVRSDVLDLPLVLQPWEPAYALAVYEDDAAHFDPPPRPRLVDVDLPARSEDAAAEPDVDEGARALVDLTGHWSRESNGRIEVAAVEGDHRAAIAALGVASARAAALPAATALAWMAWAAASGGAHGRRRGGAAGRFGAWWTAAALAGLGWPPDPDELGTAVAELRWFWWDAHEPTTGWQLRLAVWDPADDLAWALTASDDD
jgi:hypothetical protein